jgi:O-acetyl-ADP-ribose deacetylase (regulator of RNase III)
MEKILTVLLSTTVLQGCFFQVTSASDIKAAMEYCKNNGGVDRIIVKYSGDEYAECNDPIEGMYLLDKIVVEQYLKVNY